MQEQRGKLLINVSVICELDGCTVLPEKDDENLTGSRVRRGYE